MVSGAGNTQIPPVFGALLAAQAAAAERLAPGALAAGIPVPAGGTDAGSQGVASFSHAVLGQLASLLARSGGVEAAAMSPPWVAPGAAPPGVAPPQVSAMGGNLLADGAQRPGQPETGLIGPSTGEVRSAGAAFPAPRMMSGIPIALIAAARSANPGTAQPVSMRRLQAALRATTAGGPMAAAAPPMLRRELLGAIAAMANGAVGAGGAASAASGTAGLPAERLAELDQRARTAPVAELVAMAQFILQQTSLPAVPPVPVSSPPLAAESGLPVVPGVRQVAVAGISASGDDPARPVSGDAEMVVPQSTENGGSGRTAPVAIARGAAAGASDPDAVPASTGSAPIALPAAPASARGVGTGPPAGNGGIPVGTGVVVEGILATAPAMQGSRAQIEVPDLGLPQWQSEPVRFFEAGAAGPVPATSAPVRGAQAPTAAVQPVPVQASVAPVVAEVVMAPSPAIAPTVVQTSVVPALAVPTDSGLPQETAPAVPVPSGTPPLPGAFSGGDSSVAGIPIPEVVPIQTGIRSGADAVVSGPQPAAMAGAPDWAQAVAPAGQPNGIPEVAVPAVETAAGQLGAAPVAPALPGGAVQPAVVAENEAEGVPGAPRRAGEDPLETALTGARGGAVADPGAPGSGKAPAMGNPALQAALGQLSEEIAQTPPGGIRDIELRLNSEGLGRVRVRLKLLDTGAVRIEFTTLTERAAQVLRSDLPQLAQALEGRGTTVDGAQVLVSPVGAFMGQGSPDQSRQGSRWFEHRGYRRGAGASNESEALAAAATYGRRPQLVDVLA